ncbi:MAG: hypothetical protein GC186_14855 [Rhodobacteraceae bacterium]|nr:hypothetical protein [Paracoccaceae bacterium]
MDSFKEFPTTPVSPIRDAAAVTPSDSVALPSVTRAIYIGQPGDVAVSMAGGQDVTFQSVPAGTMLPIRVGAVKATGTSAAGILALW